MIGIGNYKKNLYFRNFSSKAEKLCHLCFYIHYVSERSALFYGDFSMIHIVLTVFIDSVKRFIASIFKKR
jgi:hypothetical protein